MGTAEGISMIAIQVLVFFIIVLLPGFWAVRLLRKENLSPLNTLLYAVGFGLLFNTAVGVIANFTFGIRLLSIATVYLVLLVVLGLLSWRCGKSLYIKWLGWKPIIIPLAIYLVAAGLQYQTTLMSVNLVGSDIHLEYYQANTVFLNGYWNPLEQGSSMNACLGLAILLPTLKLLTGMPMMEVFRVLCPLVFAFLPLVLYKIYREQIGELIAVLSVLFFVTMPMFTMDMVQLVRQQQSELFFILAFLVLLDGELELIPRTVVASLFGIGCAVTHYGLSLGFIGYLVGGAVVLILMVRLLKRKVVIAKPLWVATSMIVVAVVSLGMYLGYYNYVNKGDVVAVATIPVNVIGDTTKQLVWGSTDGNALEREQAEELPPSFMSRFKFLNPYLREPMLQTAIGLDFNRASLLGKVWRVLQYLVEVCLVLGFLVLLLKYHRKINPLFLSLILVSVFVVVGMYLLTTYSYGMGATRVFQVSLMLLSPAFVVGAGTIGNTFARLMPKKSEKFILVPNPAFLRNKVILISTLILLIPYCVYNLGVVFEVAKLKPVGFIDVPYSVALSGWRVDIATVFAKEDIEALDWLENRMVSTNDDRIMYGDTHIARLMAQRFGWCIAWGEDYNEFYIVGNIRSLEYLYLTEENSYYIFLSKRNVETNTIAYDAEYASRESYNISELPLVDEKLKSGLILFDNGARIVLVE